MDYSRILSMLVACVVTIVLMLPVLVLAGAVIGGFQAGAELLGSLASFLFGDDDGDEDEDEGFPPLDEE